MNKLGSAHGSASLWTRLVQYSGKGSPLVHIDFILPAILHVPANCRAQNRWPFWVPESPFLMVTDDTAE